MTRSKESRLRFVRSAAAAFASLAGCSEPTPHPPPAPATDGGVETARTPTATLDPILVEEPTGFTTKSGGQATFRVRLKVPPDADVEMKVASLRTDLATASPTKLVFTPVDWWDPQTVTLTGVNDPLIEGNRSYDVKLGPTVSTDARFDGRRPANVQILHVDNSRPGWIVLPPSGLVTHESGDSSTFTVQLATRPTAPVTLALHSDRPSLGMVAPAELVFSPETWNLPQEAIVWGRHDAIATGNVTYHIVVEATEPTTDRSYLDLPPTKIPVLSIDKDEAGFLVTPTSGLVTHQNDRGPSANFTVALTSQPVASVTVALSSSDPDCGTVTPTSLTFTASDWKVPQRVELTGVDTKIAGVDTPYVIRVEPAVSADPSYDGFDPPDVTVTNVNTNHVGIQLGDANELTTTELGGTAKFSIMLTSRPTAPVTVPVTSNRPAEGVPLVDSVIVQPDEWSTPHPIEIRGVADDVEDGDQPYTIRVGSAISDDPGYDGLWGPDASVINLDTHSHYLSVRRLTVDAEATLDDATADLDKLVFHDSYQAYLLDVASGQQTLVSQSSTGMRGYGYSFGASLSDDGRFVVFTSDASNLVDGDTNDKYDIFLRDVQAGTTTRVSMGLHGQEPPDHSARPSISADGRWVAFNSRASNLVAGDTNGVFDVFVWDRTTGETTRMLGPGGIEPNGKSIGPRLSADGRYVTFLSEASNLVSGDTNGCEDVFVWDRVADLIKRVNVSSTGAQSSLAPENFLSISADGQLVGFNSRDVATFDPPTVNYEGASGGYAHDLRAGRTLNIVVGEDGTPLPRRTWETNFVNVGASGRFVSFIYDRPAAAWVYDFAAARSRRVVLSGWSALTTIPSNDGKRVVFSAKPDSSAPYRPYDLFIASRP